MQTPRNPNHGKYREQTKGYEDLGWQMEGINHPKNVACKAAGHKQMAIDNSIHQYRGTDRIYFCDECKILRHIDSSD